MSAPGAHRGGPRAGRLWAPRLLLLLVVAALSAASPAAADAEVFPEYPRPAREQEAPAKWPQPERQAAESEDDVVERLLGGSDGKDLEKERFHLAKMKQEQEQREERQGQQQRQQQQQQQLEDALQQRQREQQQKAELQKQQQNAVIQQLQLSRQQQPKQSQEQAQQAQQAAAQQPWGIDISGMMVPKDQFIPESPAHEAARQRWEKAVWDSVAQQQEQQHATVNQKQPAAAAKPQDAPARARQQEDRPKLEQLPKEAKSAKQQQQQAVGLEDQLPMSLAGRLNDLTRALEQQPKVPDLDKALYRAFLQPAATGTEQEWQNYRSLVQPEDTVFSDIIKDDLLRQDRERQQVQDLFRSPSLQEMERHVQRQAQSQDRRNQEIMRQQHDQVDEETARMFEQASEQAQPAFTYNFPQPSHSEFAISPAERGFYQPILAPVAEDVRLQLLARHAAQSGSQPAQRAQPQEDQYDESAGRVPDLAAAAEQRLLGDVSAAQDDVLEDEGMDLDDMALAESTLLRDLQRERQQRVTQPVQPEQQRHPAKPTKAGRLEDDRGTNLSGQDAPVVKKQLTFPKDHWFFGMDDVGKLAIFIGCSIAVSSMILGFIVWQYRLHRNAKAAADVEYPAYGVTGPNKDISPTGDRRLAQSAQMYHYQHQKQQILAMESRAAGGRRGSMSEAESEDENEEGDYTVYECPGLAPTQEMEVKNPLFQDDPTPATPLPGLGAEAGHDGDGLPEGSSAPRKGSAASKKSSADGDRAADDAAPAKNTKPNNSSRSSKGPGQP